MAVRAPPGGAGDEGRPPVLAPVAAAAVPTGEDARGDDCFGERWVGCSLAWVIDR